MYTKVLVIGLGYFGLPLAREAAQAGLRVVGYDTSAEIVEGLTAGRSHIDDLTDAEIAVMRAQGFRATTDVATAGQPDVIVICVPTPLSVADGPDLSAVRAATVTAGGALPAGARGSLGAVTLPGAPPGGGRPQLGEG